MLSLVDRNSQQTTNSFVLHTIELSTLEWISFHFIEFPVTVFSVLTGSSGALNFNGCVFQENSNKVIRANVQTIIKNSLFELNTGTDALIHTFSSLVMENVTMKNNEKDGHLLWIEGANVQVLNSNLQKSGTILIGSNSVLTVTNSTIGNIECGFATVNLLDAISWGNIIDNNCTFLVPETSYSSSETSFVESSETTSLPTNTAITSYENSDSITSSTDNTLLPTFESTNPDASQNQEQSNSIVLPSKLAVKIPRHMK